MYYILMSNSDPDSIHRHTHAHTLLLIQNNRLMLSGISLAHVVTLTSLRQSVLITVSVFLQNVLLPWRLCVILRHVPGSLL